MIEQIATNPWIVVCSYVVAVVGIVLACVFYYQGIEKFVLGYEVCERTLMRVSESRPFDLDFPLVSKGREIEQLTRSYFLITNLGNKLIEPKDIVGRATMTTVNEVTIISASIVGFDDPGSQVQIVAGDEKVRELGFEFLRPDDAFIIKVDHTGSTNELFVNCHTKAGGAIRRAGSGAIAPSAFVALTFIASIVGGAIVLVVGSGGQHFLESEGYLQRTSILLIASTPILTAIMLLILIAPAIRYLFKRFVTKSYRRGPTVRLWREIVADNSIYIP